MAFRISVLNHHRPQIEYGETAEWREVAEFLSARSTVSAADVIAVLTGLQEALLHFHRQGRGVRLEGLGTCVPSINYRGEFDVAFRPDKGLKRGANDGSFGGTIQNSRSIGKTSAEVIALWNAEHPDDPVID
jgi:hypothetical protein